MKQIKTTIHAPVQKAKYGKITITRYDLEAHEEETIFRLASCGFDVETVAPSYIPNTKNPDLSMLGTFWEMKSPISTNEKTLKTMLRKAVRQSGGRVIFDLNRIPGNTNKTTNYILELFKTTRSIHRVMIIQKDATILDVAKQ